MAESRRTWDVGQIGIPTLTEEQSAQEFNTQLNVEHVERGKFVNSNGGMGISCV